ncbi:hypothetical protein [Tepidiforma sp.]|uniref:hypothetical protein n=1 Tax=Tepidiforma sp. TaxID=2682230 RepID=UPI002ADE1B26|nr:hypothetical protein [Tepidiforma sp.]
MTPDRLDDLLARALETGTIPPDASPHEQAQLEQLLAARENLLAARHTIDREADAAMPLARARFQRYLAARQPTPAQRPTHTASPHLLARLLQAPRLPLAASLAALLLIALAALLLTDPLRGTQQAQALGLDDYVQLAGTVTQSDNSTILVDQPDLGPIRIDTTEAIFLDTDGNTLDRPPAPGEHILVAGIVREARAGRILIAAQTLSTSAAPNDETPGHLQRLSSLDGAPEGTIRLVAIDPAGRSGRAIVALADGRRALVEIDPASLGALLAATGTSLGSRVRLADDHGPPFSLEPLDSRPGQSHSGGPGRAALHLAGTIADVKPKTFTLQTSDGPVTIERRPGLRILPGASGLTQRDLRKLESLQGYPAVVAGFLDSNGQFRAHLIVLSSPN